MASGEKPLSNQLMTTIALIRFYTGKRNGTSF